jgi:hypothetical protein
MPQTLTTDGRIILASSPPTSPAHALVGYVEQAEARGALVRRTIYQVPHVPREKADEYIAEAGGPESTTARREYLAEIIVDESEAIVPEFARNRDRIVCEVAAPKFRDWYCAADFGFSDLTFAIWAWYDFASARIVVEHEYEAQGTSGLEVGHAVRQIEREHEIEPRARVADAPAQLLADLAHPTLGPGVAFGPAIKDDADAALNRLRTEIQIGRIAINPRCKRLIAHLEYGVWATKERRTFARHDGFGHYDAIDALKYLLRIVDRRKNPTPDVLPSVRREDARIPPKKPTAWENAYAPRRGW